VNRVGARAPRGVEDRIDAEVALRRRCGPDGHRLIRLARMGRPRIRLAVDGDGVDPQLLAGPDDPQRYLAAVGDEHFMQHEASETNDRDS
jgi:hypothetical protein